MARRYRIALAVLLLLLLPPGAKLGAQTQDAPAPLFTTTETAPQAIAADVADRALIEGTIDGAGLWFHLDTGATGLAIAESAVARLAPGAVPADEPFTADLTVGSFRAHDARFAVIPYHVREGAREVAGIIGAPFFRSNVVTIDFPDRRVVVFPRGHFDSREVPGSPQPMFLDGGRPSVDVRWGTRTLRMLLDTGAAETFVFERFANGVTRGSPLDAGRLPLGFGRKPTPIREYATEPLTWGRLHIVRPHVFVARDEGAGDAAAGYQGILGRDILRYVAITLDYANGLIYF